MTNDRRKMNERSARRRLRCVVSAVWGFLREVSGEAACERYRRTARGCEEPAGSYLRYLEEKYSRPCRCC